MTRNPVSAPRGLSKLLVLAATLSVLAASAVSAQDECVGFERRDVISGGTNGVESLHVVDVDDDGDLDFLSASFGDGRVYWFENDANPNDPGYDPLRTPTFKAHLVSNGLDNASSVGADDLDGDGDIDFVGSSRDFDGVFWYEQAQGNPPFFSPRTVSRDTALPLSVFTADVDGDGDNDVLTASFLDHTVAWHENVGGTPPSFTKRVITTAAQGAASVFAADVDGDGDLDAISAARLATPVADGGTSAEENWGVAWYEQTDQLDEETQEIIFIAHEVWTTSKGATSVFAADVDDDGDMDVLSATHADDTIAWHENDGADPPVFTARTISTAALGARTVVVGFVNDDSHLDVLSASQQDDKIAWYVSDGAADPTFTEVVVTTDATHADDVRVGDFDNDGDTDIVTASSVPGFPASEDEIRWYENVGPGAAPQFVRHDVYYSANGAISAVAAKLDDDEFEDVATAGRTNQIAWYRSDGASLPSFEERIISLDALGASDVAAADLDGDGDVDLVSSSRDDNKIAWYENDGAAEPTFTEHVISTNVVNAWDVYIADLDGDLDLDIIAAANVAPEPAVEPPEGEDPVDPDPVDNIYWFRNDGAVVDPQFTEIVISQNAAGARSVFAEDLDADGDLDVLSAAYDDHKIAWYENVPGPNPDDPPDFSAEHVVTLFAFGAASVFAADLDGDMEPDDILTAESINWVVAWYQRQPDPEPDPEADPDPEPPEPVYTRYVIANGATDVSSAIAHELNGDDRIDVVAAAPGEQVIGWFENLGGTPAVWESRLVTVDADYSEKVTIGDLNHDQQPDILSGSRLSVFWYEGSGEICDMFDADGDGLIDGIELAWIGRSFGMFSADPAAEWWGNVDYNQDGTIDGEDLAILSSPGVFGATTETCSYICR